MSTILLVGLVAGLAYGVLKARQKTYTIPYIGITVGPSSAALSPPGA